MKNIKNVIDNSYGGKAYGLSLLNKHGLNIPITYCIAPREEIELDGIAELEKNGFYHVAVRSSSIIEDAADESKAGCFITKIGNYTRDQLKIVIKQVRSHGEQMGIVVQQAIDAEYSGVVFSSDPLTYSKKRGVLSFVQGMGAQLVGGQAGEDVEVDFDGYNGPFYTVVRDVKKLENKLGYPIDVEWCMKDGQIWYLQCRPITSITKIKSGYYKVDERIICLPVQLTLHDKIKLRMDAQRDDIFISDAYIHVKNTAWNQKATNEIKISPYCRGYSVVITYPDRISEKVIRSFVGSNEKLSQGIGKCYRYGIRSYPKYQGLDECINSFHEMANDYWVSSVIVQEVFDAIYTGIIQKIENGYLIEITKGHFLTKGNVITSQYYVSDGQVVSKNEIHQHEWYRIVQGHIIQCECFDDDNTYVSINSDEIKDIVDSFSKIIESEGRVVEFGLLRDCTDLIPYLIDFVDTDEGTHISPSDIEEGIISRGKRKGRILKIEDSKNALDKHFHDKINSAEQKAEDLIFFCKTPNITLLELLNEYDNSRISFVFEEGSLLCHFAVVLREKGIPAVKIGNVSDIKEGWYILDAETNGLSREGRLIFYEFDGNI